MGEIAWLTEGVGHNHVVEVVDLRLEQVAVGVLVVDAGGGAVVDGPQRQDAPRAPLPVRRHEVAQRVEGEGHVLEPRRRPHPRPAPGKREDGHPVVLRVVAQERHVVVLVDGVGAEERLVERDHRLEVGRPEHDVRELRRRKHLAAQTAVGHCDGELRRT